jgi:hypothetical protein
MTSPDGRGFLSDTLFDTDTPYIQIKPVRQALTAFAAQQCGLRIGQEARSAVKPSSGLHAKVLTTRSRTDSAGEIEWSDLGEALQHASNCLQETQPLAIHFLKIIAEPAPRSRKGVLTIRKSRPRDNVRQ